jgi:hypothetical protein
MARGGFALGLLIGGLGGLAAGYVLSKNGSPEADIPIQAIELTDALKKNDAHGGEAIEPRAAAVTSKESKKAKE